MSGFQEYRRLGRCGTTSVESDGVRKEIIEWREARSERKPSTVES